MGARSRALSRIGRYFGQEEVVYMNLVRYGLGLVRNYSENWLEISQIKSLTAFWTGLKLEIILRIYTLF